MHQRAFFCVHTMPAVLLTDTGMSALRQVRPSWWGSGYVRMQKQPQDSWENKQESEAASPVNLGKNPLTTFNF